ncbi:MAG: hypothetical protein WBB28_20790 [Crinalium sp.]
MDTNKPSTFKAEAKSLFSSQTFWGFVCTAVLAITPYVVSQFEKGRVTAADMGAIAMAMASAGLGIKGRIEARDEVYTPDWLPGPNRSDLIPPAKESEG